MRFLLIPALLFICAACSTPRVCVSLNGKKASYPTNNQVGVLGVDAPTPADAEVLGELSVNDIRIYEQGGQNAVLYQASREALIAGGNVLNLTEMTNGFKTKIVGEILSVANPDTLEFLRDYRFNPIRPKSSFKMNKWEVNVGIGGEAEFATEEFLIGVMDVWYGEPSSVKDMHRGSYDVSIWPTISINGVYNLDREWAIVGSFGLNIVKAEYFNPYTDVSTGKETTFMFDMLAGLRYKYVHEKNMSIYSQLMFGATFHSKGEYWNHNSFAEKHFGWQVTGIGVTFGSRIYGFTELGWGSEYGAILVPGCRVGVGIKF